MKNKLIGLGLLLLAAYILFKDYLVLPGFGMSIWTLALVLIFVFCSLQSLLRRNYIAAYACGVITFIVLERHFDWLHVGTGTIILASILIGIGMGMLIKPKGIYFIMKNGDIDEATTGSYDYDTVFANTSRYVDDDHFTDMKVNVTFSSAAIYFNDAVILGDRASYSGDAIFSNVTLHVPKNWNVEFKGDRVFSSIKIASNTEPTDKTLAVTGDLVFSQLEVIYV